MLLACMRALLMMSAATIHLLIIPWESAAAFHLLAPFRAHLSLFNMQI